MRISDWSSDVCSSDLQQRGKHVAFLVDHPADVAFGMAAALKATVEIFVHRWDMHGNGGILDHEAVRVIHAQLDQLLPDFLGPPNQYRYAIAEIAQLDRTAQCNFLLGLVEHNPPGMRARLLLAPHPAAGGGVGPPRAPLATGGE